MYLTEAKNLKAGDYVHTPNRYNADGTPMRARVTSVKIWKREPARIEVRVKRGMREFATFTSANLSDIEIGYGS